VREGTRFIIVAGLAALGLLTHGPAPAAAQGNSKAVMYVAPNTPDSIRRDTAAVNALVRMGEYLRTLNKFEVKADFLREEVLTDGQKIQFAGTARALADRPGRLLAELTDDRIKRVFFFDGQDFTLWAPRAKYYATVPMQGTIGDLVDSLDTRFAIETPLVDLFRWGTSTADLRDITGAKDIGDAVIDGVNCSQYAFRQAGVDWQVWIQDGEFPLPHKVVITTLTDDARPQYQAQYSWNLAPSIHDDAFKFSPPEGAMKIKLMDLKNKTGGK
jgi:hypothetical protein